MTPRRIGSKWWYFPRHDHTPRQVTSQLILAASKFAVWDPVRGENIVVDERELHKSFQDAKKALLRRVADGKCFENAEIQRRRDEIRRINNELRMIRKIRQPKPKRQKSAKAMKNARRPR